LDNVATALQGANKPNRHDEPCEPGDNKRSSDLCAQWKAADAARDTANYTLQLGWLGLLIGALTLGAAIAAAKFASDAATYTQAGANEAKRAANAAEQQLALGNKISEIELRAYIRSLEETFQRDPADPLKFTFRLPFKNVGHTPAQDVITYFASWFVTYRNVKDATGHRGGKPSNPMNVGSARWGTVANEQDITLFQYVTFSKTRLGLIVANKGVFYMDTTTYFVDEFGTRWVHHQMFYLNGRALANDCINTRYCKTERAREPEESDEDEEPPEDEDEHVIEDDDEEPADHSAPAPEGTPPTV